MITIKDVAHRAGVAPGTVSNVLTGKRAVAAATRERVMEAVEEMGYQPNILARSLVNRRSESLAVVASGLEYYGPSRMVVGVEEGARELGYSLLLHLLPWGADDPVESLLRSLRARRVDGIVWAIPEMGHNRDWITPDALRGLPPTIFLNMEARPGPAIVTVDNAGGATQGIHHLLEQGRRRIGMITGPLEWWSARSRLAGWRAALVAAGRGFDPELVVEGNWTAASGAAALESLAARWPDLDAVVTAGDNMALGALRAAHSIGRQVPGDLAIVGFDGEPESAYFWPPLTTVWQPLIDMGRIAVKQLHHMIAAGEDLPTSQSHVTVMRTQLIVRESSGPPPARTENYGKIELKTSSRSSQ